MESQETFLIKTQDEMDKLLEYLADKDFIAFDTETDGVHYGANIVGMSVATEVDKGYYVPVAYWDTVNQKLVHMDLNVVPLLELLERKDLIMHNAVFDCMRVMENYRIDLMPRVHTDTWILGQLLNENRFNGLKERAVELYGEDAAKEKAEMKASVEKNGGSTTKDNFEMYKADMDLLGHYGAKDAILTLKLFYNDVPQLDEEGLFDFFYNDESMPLLRGPTYHLNSTGLKVDADRLSALKAQLTADIAEAKAFIDKELYPLIKDEYPGTKKKNTFNVGSNNQLAWLVFDKLENPFGTLTAEGKKVCKALGFSAMPYSTKAKKEFATACRNMLDFPYAEKKKVKNYWTYTMCGRNILISLGLHEKYTWVAKLLEMKKNTKLLNTYIDALETKTRYGVIHPNFLQAGTTSGRYSSREPNFQNLPRDDKRVKSCIVARQGMAFVGSDYSQLEPRVFASQSQDPKLLECFASGQDFYSVIGAEVFEKPGLSLVKDDADSFAKKYPHLRQMAKVIALSSTYGTTAPKMGPALGKSTEEAQSIIDSYFCKFPAVYQFMLESHELAKKEGRVVNMYGRPRRLPRAKDILNIYGNMSHDQLPYSDLEGRPIRSLLNLAVNHRVQSTGASIVNRAAIACVNKLRELAKDDARYGKVRIVMQIHDELVLEAPEEIAEEVKNVLRDTMENTVALPGVKLIAEPKIANNLADLK